MNFNQKVEDLLSLALDQHPNIFLVELKISADKSIKIILDGDQELNVKDCISISRAIEGALDRDEEDFSLEVASAGCLLYTSPSPRDGLLSRIPSSG